MIDIYKFIKYDDEITGTIYTVDGYQFFHDIKARIFVDNIYPYQGADKKVKRYFPQIDNDIKEEVFIIGDQSKGYQYLKNAKRLLIECLDEYLRTGTITERS